MFYNRIRSRREELGISQDDLARRVGCKSRSPINKIDKNKNDITQSKIAEIATALDTAPEYLMGWQNETKPLNAQEAEFVDGYRELNDEGKRLVVGIVRQLNFKHGGAIPHRQAAALWRGWRHEEIFAVAPNATKNPSPCERGKIFSGLSGF